jgi:hypothetical protein
MSETNHTRGYPNGIIDMRKHIDELQTTVERQRNEIKSLLEWKASVLKEVGPIPKVAGIGSSNGVLIDELEFTLSCAFYKHQAKHLAARLVETEKDARANPKESSNE